MLWLIKILTYIFNHITHLLSLTTYLNNTGKYFIDCHIMGLKVDMPISL